MDVSWCKISVIHPGAQNTNPPLWKSLNSDTFAGYDNVHPTFFSLLTPK